MDRELNQEPSKQEVSRFRRAALFQKWFIVPRTIAIEDADKESDHPPERNPDIHSYMDGRCMIVPSVAPKNSVVAMAWYVIIPMKHLSLKEDSKH